MLGCVFQCLWLLLVHASFPLRSPADKSSTAAQEVAMNTDSFGSTGVSGLVPHKHYFKAQATVTHSHTVARDPY